MRPAHCLVVVGTSIAAVLAAPRAQGGESPWSVRVWQSEGLPDRHINGITQTEDGFLWLATSYHVARFDGTRFESFATSDVVPRAIRTLHLGRDGLLVTTNRQPAVHLRSGEPPLIVDTLPLLAPDVTVEDDEGAVWIGFHEGHISRLKDGRVTTFGAEAGLADTGSCFVARDRRGRVWYSQAGRVGLFTDGRFRPLVTVPHPSPRLTAARDGGVWIGAGARLFHYDEGGALAEKGVLPSPHESARAMVMLETRDGAVWIGTRNDGLFRLGPAGIEVVPTSHPAIRCLFEDREGNLWVGTGGGGLNRVQPRVLEVEGARTGLAAKLLQTVTEAPDGTLWGATSNGLVVRRGVPGWERASFGPHTVAAANCVTADARGAIWIGTRSNALYRWWRGRLTRWGAKEGLHVRGTCTLAATRGGDVWIAGELSVAGTLQAGALRLRDDRLERVAIPGVRRLFALAEDAAGAVWLGAAHGIVLRAQDAAPVEVAGLSRAVDLQIRALHATADGALWIGYEGGGVGRWKDGRFARLGREQGLTSLDVAQIVADDRALWLGTDAGLIRLDRAEAEAVLEGQAARVRPVAIRSDEGSFTVTASACGWLPAVQTRGGEIWMPMGTALLIVHPEKMAAEAGPPRTLLVRATVDGDVRGLYADFIHRPPTGPSGVDLRTAAALSLRPGDRRLEIELAAPTFRAPEDVRFRYRLDGLDEDWIEAGTERIARYPRLPPGSYRFHAASCIGAGPCQETASALDIRVAPLFWQTGGFRLAALLTFSVAVGALVRYVSFRRLRRRLAALQQQAALDRERTRIARDIHDDVGNRLNRITLLSELALRNGTDPAHMSSQVREISSSVRDVIGALDEVVWAVSPRHDTLPHLVSRLGQFAAEYLRAAGVRSELALPAQPPDWPLSAEARHNVLCAVKEALTNAVRHGRPQAVKLSVEVAADAFTVAVEDDGAGFLAAPTDPGADGLRNMAQRMAEIGGRMDVESAPGRGTRIRLWLPRPRTSSPADTAV